MSSVAAFAERGGPVIGSCNGFQILCEAGLLPGALLRNRDIRFHCETTWLRTESTSNPFTSACSPGQVLQIPISHGEGNYFADPETLDRLESTGRVVFRYSDAHGNVTDEVNPNGSLNNIAGILNERGNVLGMMPHPERVCEELLGGTDGRYIIESMVSSALAQVRG
jgi:phosphoribosylformylglycinamidine synthase